MKVPAVSADLALKVGAGVALIGLVYFVVTKLSAVAGAAATQAGGLVSGNNAITEAARTDAYQGAGVVGTLGAATDIASGGALSTLGEHIGSTTYDLTHPDPVTGLWWWQSAPDPVPLNSVNGHTAYWKS